LYIAPQQLWRNAQWSDEVSGYAPIGSRFPSNARVPLASCTPLNDEEFAPE
jgi:hypothetical protein